MHTSASLIDRIAAPESLMAAWKQVRANRGAEGVDRVTTQRFEANLERNLAALSSALCEERYYPMPLRQVQIPKRDGGTRDLGISTVEDRIVQRGMPWGRFLSGSSWIVPSATGPTDPSRTQWRGCAR